MPKCIECEHSKPSTLHPGEYYCRIEGVILPDDYECSNFTEKLENKEEKKMPEKTRKTEAEITAELEAKENEVQELKEELKKLEQYKKYEEGAAEIFAIQDSFVNAGFTREEAFTLMLEIVRAAMPVAGAFPGLIPIPKMTRK